jgi:hypothetical protein
VTRSFIQLPPDGAGKSLLTELDASNHVQILRLHEPPSFYAIYDRIAPAANKYMATLWNGAAGRLVRVHRVVVFNWNWTAVTGVILEQYLARIIARTIGTVVTPRALDTNDALTAGIAADTNSTTVTEDHIIRRHAASAEEVKIGALTLENVLGVPWPDAGQAFGAVSGMKPITLRSNQGVTIRNVTSSTIGTVSYVIEFTDEAP